MSAKICKFEPLPVKPDPCPFCHSEETGWTFLFSNLCGPIKFFAFCFSCHARGPERTNKEDAIAGWNIEKKYGQKK